MTRGSKASPRGAALTRVRYVPSPPTVTVVLLLWFAALAAHERVERLLLGQQALDGDAGPAADRVEEMAEQGPARGAALEARDRGLADASQLSQSLLREKQVMPGGA